MNKINNVIIEGGETEFKVDNHTFIGGSGSQPDPMHYCFYGLASCYASRFATMVVKYPWKVFTF